MKKIASTLFLATIFVFSLSTNAIAEGEIPIGGRNCPQDTTCVTGEIPIGGKTCPPNTTCVTGEIPIGGLTSDNTQAEDTTIFKTVIDYLAQLFG
ncbi:MAG: hypothetical protein M3384_20720 [Acidobacteriota bacterium]|nr:hypothetical protein [Acidobacteriota bacterium]